MVRGCIAATLGVVLVGAAACGTSATAPPGGPTASAPAHSIVALGDSVPRGTNCGCTPYPDLTAEDLASRPGLTVTAVNDSVAGYTSADVLHQLDAPRVASHVAAADAVEIEVGANDVGYSISCGASLNCYTADVPQVEKNLTRIVARVHALAGGKPVLVVLLDYWSVWLGGAYAAERGEAYVATAGQLTGQINAVIRTVAAASGAAYVDLREAFKGPDYAYDETHYLSDDGDHPNAAGHERIAEATTAVIEQSLHL